MNLFIKSRRRQAVEKILSMCGFKPTYEDIYRSTSSREPEGRIEIWPGFRAETPYIRAGSISEITHFNPDLLETINRILREKGQPPLAFEDCFRMNQAELEKFASADFLPKGREFRKVNYNRDLYDARLSTTGKANYLLEDTLPLNPADAGHTAFNILTIYLNLRDELEKRK